MHSVVLPKFQRVQIRQSGVASMSSITVAISEEPSMLRRMTVVAFLAALSCTGCTGLADEPVPSVSPSSARPTIAPSPAPTPTPSAEPTLEGYSEEEAAAYEAAVSAYDRFAKRSDKFYEEGATTNAAKEFFQRFSIDWSRAWGDLAQIANSGVTVAGSTKTVSTKPESIELDTTAGDVVVLRRCLDESGRVVTQDGEEIDQPQLQQPHIYTVRLERRPSEGRWRSGVAEQEGTC